MFVIHLLSLNQNAHLHGVVTAPEKHKAATRFFDNASSKYLTYRPVRSADSVRNFRKANEAASK